MFISLITSLVSTLNRWIVFAAVIISLALYIYFFVISYLGNTFVIQTDQTMLLSFNLAAALMCIINLVFLIIGEQGNEVILVCIVLILAVSFGVVIFLIRKKIVRDAELLDKFMDRAESDPIKESMVAPLAISGFQFAHPCCVDFSFLKDMSEKYPSNSYILSVYAKFAAIYPENDSRLVIIGKHFLTTKSKYAKITVNQISHILQSREANLSPVLKRKMSAITKTVNKSKRKLQNIWDLILQGNTKDMESNIDIAFEAVNKTQNELNHLLTQFPNNKFVARLYARFYSEIMADSISAQKWQENVKLLQRGVLVNADATHDFGLATFPNMPQHIQTSLSTTFNNHDSDSITDDIFSEEDSHYNSKAYISTLVENHHMPSMVFTRVSSIISLIVLYAFPLIFLLCYNITFQAEIEKPLSHMISVSYLRQLNTMVATWTLRLFMEELPDKTVTTQKFADFIEVPGSSYENLGGTSSTLDQLKFIIGEVVGAANQLSAMRGFKSGSASIDKAVDILFSNSVPYYYYTSGTERTQTDISAEAITVRITNQISKTLEKTIDETSLYLPETLTTINNFNDAGLKMCDALTYINDYVVENYEYNYLLYVIIEVVLSVVIFIATLIISILDVKKLSENKSEIFRVLTYLPKTVISNVSASFHSVKSADAQHSNSSLGVSEVSRQEENIIKVFTSISDSSSSVSEAFVGISMQMAVVALMVIALFFVCDGYRQMNSVILQSAPHIDYIFGADTFVIGFFAGLFKYTLQKNGYPGLEQNVNDNLAVWSLTREYAVDYYNKVRCGGYTSSDYSFVSVIAMIDEASRAIACDPQTVYTTEFDVYKCLDVDLQFYLTTSMLDKITMPAIVNGGAAKPRGSLITETWALGGINMYNAYLYPMTNRIIPSIIEDVKSKYTPMIVASVVILIIIVFLEAVNIYQTFRVETKFRFLFGQLMHCPDEAIMQIPKLVTLLSGQYGASSDESSDRSDAYFFDVVNKLTSLVAVVNLTNNTFISTNRAFNETFGLREHELDNSDVDFFFTEERFGPEIVDLEHTKLAKVSFTRKDETMWIQFTATNVAEYIIIEGVDISMQVKHQNLMNDEKQKSDELLACILPASLVPRVQAGHTNISFSVKSATISFIDIVSFTPWCGSHDAQYVMKMLNIIFKEFDACIAALPTMTRIKCIGDCYMSAGGIFDEVNNPVVHAKETVEFGCQAIAKIREINESHKETLQIRVGVNTGGPIVAGILGTDKPTFEILGPAINIAQQMEHNGIPMNVHLSRSVYELIYGDKFEIKERGEIEVKNGKMFTYLIAK